MESFDFRTYIRSVGDEVGRIGIRQMRFCRRIGHDVDVELERSTSLETGIWFQANIKH